MIMQERHAEKSIDLKNITQIVHKDKTDITFTLEIDHVVYELKYCFYGIGCEIGKVTERFDSVAVSFLYFAIRFGYNLNSDIPISERLLYQLKRQIIPQLCSANPNETYHIKITAPLAESDLEKGSWIGTGVSCGVDSLSAIYELINDNPFPDNKLTHLVYLKIGQHAEASGFDIGKENKHFEDGLKNAISFAKEIGLPVVVGESNLNEVVSKAFGWRPLVTNFTYRNIGCMLILQNLFCKYFYASGYPHQSNINILDDVAHYERWLIPYLCTDNLQFNVTSSALNRVEKTALISDWNLSWNHLSVCWLEEKNCGYCSKCLRTLTTLDLLGKLDNYKNVFDLAEYRKRRKAYMAYVSLKKDKQEFFNEIYEYAKNQNIKIADPIDMSKVMVKKLKNGRYPMVKVFY